MNERDLNNLKFLLHCDPEVLRNWYKDASLDELEYANELITEFTKKVMEELEHKEEVNDVTQARQVLARFML